MNKDDCPQNPREWDNLGTMVCSHKLYYLGDEQAQNAEGYFSWDVHIFDNNKDFENFARNHILLQNFVEAGKCLQSLE